MSGDVASSGVNSAMLTSMQNHSNAGSSSGITGGDGKGIFPIKADGIPSIGGSLDVVVSTTNFDSMFESLNQGGGAFGDVTEKVGAVATQQIGQGSTGHGANLENLSTAELGNMHPPSVPSDMQVGKVGMLGPQSK